MEQRQKRPLLRMNVENQYNIVDGRFLQIWVGSAHTLEHVDFAQAHAQRI